MNIAVGNEDGFTIVRVEGKIVRENQAQLRSRLEELIEEGLGGIVLDFEGVEYMDSAALGCCAAVQKLMQERKAGPLVVSGASPSVERMWKIIRLNLVIPLFPDTKDALARLRESSGS